MKRIGCFIFLIVLVVGGAAGLYYWNFYNKAINTANNGPSEQKIVTINQGATVEDINTLLVSEGIIKDEKFPNGMTVFKVYSVINKLDSKYQAGTYFLPQNESVKQIADSIQKSKDELINVTIKEGLRIEEFGDAINVALNSAVNTKYSKFNKDDFIKLAKNYTNNDGKYEFLKTRPAGITTLEGFLYPDTYFVTRDASSQMMIDLLLQTFDVKVYQPYKGQIQNNKYTVFELVTLASIVEREVNSDDDRAMVADMLFRRLVNDDLGRKLETDATLLYVLGNEKIGWWKAELNYTTLQTKSPYNGRLTPGLPPTPIASPSLS